MAIIKDSELKAARLQIQTAINKLNDLERDLKGEMIFSASYISDHLEEALAHLNNE